jgi:hypothetical protein
MEGFWGSYGPYVGEQLVTGDGKSVHFHPWIFSAEEDTFACIRGQQNSPAKIEGGFITEDL